MKSVIAMSLLAGLAAASPTISKRAEFCGQWDSEVAGDYTVYNNLWGKDSANSGSQCTTNNGLGSDGSLSWSTSWTWAGGSTSVKSYANVVVKSDKKALSAVSSIPSRWSWSYAGDGITANVAYDLFTGSSADGDAEYEFMIWLGALGGAGPISSTGSAIATVDLAGSSWDLYKGPNGQMTVFSFVSKSGDVQFDGDLTDFTKYLVSSQGVSDSQILQSVGAGTEPFVGTNAVFTTTKYSASVA